MLAGAHRAQPDAAVLSFAICSPFFQFLVSFSIAGNGFGYNAYLYVSIFPAQKSGVPDQLLLAPR